MTTGQISAFSAAVARLVESHDYPVEVAELLVNLNTPCRGYNLGDCATSPFDGLPYKWAEQGAWFEDRAGNHWYFDGGSEADGPHSRQEMLSYLREAYDNIEDHLWEDREAITVIWAAHHG